MIWKDGYLQMAIKMRSNSDKEAFCMECGDEQDQVLNMFDICIAGEIITVCDKCNETLFNKTLHAECLKSGRLKSKKDMAIIRKRASRIGLKHEKHVSIAEALRDVGDSE